MKKLLMALCVGSSLCGTAATATAQTAPAAPAAATQQIGFVDTARVYRESKDARRINDSLQKEFAARQKSLVDLEQRGYALQEALQKNSLQGAEREKLQEQMAQLNRQYIGERTRFTEEFNLRRAEEFAALQQKANQVIVGIARAHNFDFLLTDVVYVNQKYDITDEVIQELNKE